MLDSTPILDVVRTYGKAGLVRIAATAADFVLEIEGVMASDLAASKLDYNIILYHTRMTAS